MCHIVLDVKEVIYWLCFFSSMRFYHDIWDLGVPQPSINLQCLSLPKKVFRNLGLNSLSPYSVHNHTTIPILDIW